MASRINRFRLTLHTMMALFSIAGCTLPKTELASGPPFGQSVRTALQAQELPVNTPPKSVHATYIELQQSLESLHKAKPMPPNTNRNNMSNSARNFGQ